MTKEQILELIKLLSALESWSFSSKTDIPDYLKENICKAVEELSAELLE